MPIIAYHSALVIGMNNAASTTSIRPFLWAVSAIGLAVLAGVGTYWMQRPPATAVPAPVATTVPTTRPATIAVIAQEARDLKLITWSFETTVDAQSVSDKWYGDSVANVRAPVRYQYGVDLETLEERSIFRDAATGELMFIVKPPKRLSVEVDVERLEQSLQTSGMRWKSRNQSQLEETLKELGAIANSLVLSPKDEQRMREASRQQIEKHLHRVLARIEPGAIVNVKFAE
jgi:hypothetical protein